MAFEKIKNKTPKSKGKCSLCSKADKAGTISIQVRDVDTKVVASRSAGVCEQCGETAYTEAVKASGL